MRDEIAEDLSNYFDKAAVDALLETYEELVAKHRGGNLEEALMRGGRFVEHALRLIEGKRTGVVPPEIKSVAATIRTLENDTILPETLRLLIPRVLYGMIYNLRSKRDAVHVKEIDPTSIDVAMTVSAASWVIAELLRMHHNSDEEVVRQRMLALTRTSIPFIEARDGETFVNRNVKPATELLLLLANASPIGMTRRLLGTSAKCSDSAVTRGLQALEAERFVHRSASGSYFITSSGKMRVAQELANSVTQTARKGHRRRTPLTPTRLSPAASRSRRRPRG
jgi:hypothetical protein